MKRLTELAGLALVVAGVGAIDWRVAIIAAGLGFVLYAQGDDDDSSRQDGPRRS